MVVVKRLPAGGIVGAAVLMLILDAGSAAANNEWVGMTYAKAQQDASPYGMTLVVATKTGDYLPIDQCIVVGNRRASSTASGSRYYVDLNCNDLSAMNGHPGNSAATPEGKQVMEMKREAVSMNRDYAKAVANGNTPACFSTAAATRWCIKMCNTSKSCSLELNEALGL